MPSTGASLPLFNEAQSSPASILRAICHPRPRNSRAKGIILAVVTFVVIFVLHNPSSNTSEPDYWAKFPSRPPLSERPEDVEVAVPRRLDVHSKDTLPHDPHKPNPQLHVLVPAPESSREVCRTLASAMILEYPPPTLIGYGRGKTDGSEHERTVDRITRMRDYLRDSSTVHDRDFVLVAENVYFQLPPSVLVQRFQSILREKNLRQQRFYGFAPGHKSKDSTKDDAKSGASAPLPKYGQRVLFGASKVCSFELWDDPGCISVPPSTLPPDVHGWETDEEPKMRFGKIDHRPTGVLNRPRWMTSGTIMGQVADVRLILDEILWQIEQPLMNDNQHQALTRMYGRQEVVRELERRRTTNRFTGWLYKQLGMTNPVNISGINVQLETGHRYEYGMTVDFESQIFYNQNMTHEDINWFQFHNKTVPGREQQKLGIPRESPIFLPEEIEALHDPFLQYNAVNQETVRPTYDPELDYLPSPGNNTWSKVPFLTNLRAGTIPAVIHMNGDPAWRDDWWRRMWFWPWGRALLRKYVRFAHGSEASQSSMQGGQGWWDMRGGRGGIWTDQSNWIALSDVCNGHEHSLFEDNRGPWAKEKGDPDAPVYNQFGTMVFGKEQKEGETKQEETEEGETEEGETEKSETKEGQTKEEQTKEEQTKEEQTKEEQTKKGQTNEGETDESEKKKGQTKEGQTKEEQTKKGQTNEGETDESEKKKGQTKEGQTKEEQTKKGQTNEGEKKKGQMKEGRANEGESDEEEKNDG
ncbi:hypothetical protein NUU61_003336 [Penicillium alfredii]|uniref:Uncharacterized protein n=1 Tax=Penicillium alfredii TaxID=1506179 RepID=A0A9W9KGT1_9EURO|nr:uncharacterized protein NUU61_003336 [Penicillium alfredii]KAJ5105989.1 hypothetical protein NUU61_003336 [Penicillium alfredii]